MSSQTIRNCSEQPVIGDCSESAVEETFDKPKNGSHDISFRKNNGFDPVYSESCTSTLDGLAMHHDVYR